MKIKRVSPLMLLCYVVLAVFVVIMAFPFVWMLLGAFKTSAEITRVPPTIFPDNWMNFDNFKEIFSRYNFGIFFKNSTYYALVKTLIILYLSAIIGYVLGKFEFRMKKAIFTLILATMMVPYVAMLIPNYQMMVWFGWLDKDIAIFYTALTPGFGIFLMRQSVAGIPDSLLEAARLDGAGEFYIFHRIVMPLSLNALGSLAILTFLWEWDNYLWPYLVLNSSSKYTLAIGLAMTSGQFFTDYGALFAGIFISVMPVLLVYLLFQRTFIQGIALGGVKE